MLNARAEQGLKVLVLIASSNPCQAVNSKQLSQQLGLSISYIENLLKNLKKNELVVANRGPGGGYLLQKCVDEISVWDVVRCFEQDEEPSVQIRTREYAMSLELSQELHQIKQHFLQNYPITDITKHSPHIEKKVSVRQLSSHFKPMATRWAPKAPNSVFDLPNFMHSRAA
jgi:Rrf2 family iron-sulfur cluster assembly transcriptional regulator